MAIYLNELFVRQIFLDMRPLLPVPDFRFMINPANSHAALHTTHMSLYSLTLHCTQHTCRSTVSLCTAHNTHAALRHAASSHNTYNDVILPSVLT